MYIYVCQKILLRKNLEIYCFFPESVHLEDLAINCSRSVSKSGMTSIVGGWRKGSVAKSTGCSALNLQRTQVQVPGPAWQFTAVCNYFQGI